MHSISTQLQKAANSLPKIIYARICNDANPQSHFYSQTLYNLPTPLLPYTLITHPSPTNSKQPPPLHLPLPFLLLGSPTTAIPLSANLLRLSVDLQLRNQDIDDLRDAFKAFLELELGVGLGLGLLFGFVGWDCELASWCLAL
jgi:hypothetical protein